ncbi:hypothetical protein ABK040_003686 [Willaertia magna]
MLKPSLFSRRSRKQLGYLLFGASLVGGGFSIVYFNNRKNNMFNNDRLISPIQAEEDAGKPINASQSTVKAIRNGDHKTGKKKLVLLGAGWGSVSVLHDIDLNLYDVYIVSPRNYFIFTPMLPAAIVGTVSMQSIIEPIRSVIERKKKRDGCKDCVIDFYEAECFDIDPEKQTIKCKDTSGYVVKHLAGDKLETQFELVYDKLVVAVGAISNTFGVKGVEQNTFPMKEVKDALLIRERMLDVLESANMPHLSEEERKKSLQFVVVGGGACGVEFAGYLTDFLMEDVRKQYPKTVVDNISVVVIQSGDHVLNTMDKRISEMTEKEFKEARSINIKTNSRVVEVKENEVVLYDKETKQTVGIPFGLCIWTTGISMPEIVKTLVKKLPPDVRKDRSLTVNENLKVIGTDNIYSIGDCSKVHQPGLVEKYEDFFEQADLNNDGKLSAIEIEKFVKLKESEIPQLSHINAAITKIFVKTGREFVTKQEFKEIIQQIDAQHYRPLPSTAQVAKAQGKYLADELNQLAKEGEETKVEPFKYKHLGSFAYIGGNHSVAELGGYKVGGAVAWYLYRGVYFSKQLSWKNRYGLASDWMKTFVFGRDTSRF